jgi:hypothetical protein
LQREHACFCSWIVGGASYIGRNGANQSHAAAVVMLAVKRIDADARRCDRVSKSSRLSARLSAQDLFRFHRHVLLTGTCHIWMGAIGSDGYEKFSIHNRQDGARVISPQQVSARLAFGPIPLGSTLIHDCDVRICVSTAPGHVRVSTQRENMQQAAWRGRAAGPRPGLVDVRGKVGASRAVQHALRECAAEASPVELAEVLAQVLAEGDPLRGIVALFDPPTRRPLPVRDDFPMDLFDLAARTPPVPLRRLTSLSLFDVGA